MASLAPSSFDNPLVSFPGRLCRAVRFKGSHVASRRAAGDRRAGGTLAGTQGAKQPGAAAWPS